MTSLDKPNINKLANDTLVMLLAGGQGGRLHELTESRAKPGLEFGGGYRIIDFPLSNCVNSGFKKIGVVTQYKAQSLIRHLINGWAKFNQNFGEFLELMPASQQTSEDWYRGTADSLFQNIEFIKSVKPKFVLVLSGDHIYKMDYREMLEKHVNSGAEMTVSCIEVPIKEAAGQFGVMNVDDNDRVLSFEEKPIHPQGLADTPSYALASMGNYIFNTDFLIHHLQQDALDHQSAHDFGKDIIPKLLLAEKIQAFRFRDLIKHGTPYWRDVGTLDAYWKANMALLENEPPIILDDSSWPIWSAPSCLPPVKFVSSESAHNGNITDSLLATGCVIHPCAITRSLIFENGKIESDAVIVESVLLPNTKVGKRVVIKRAVIDRNCDIPDNIQIGVDVRDDLERGFRISKDGVVLVTQNMLDKLAKNKGKSTTTQPASNIVSLKQQSAHNSTTGEAQEDRVVGSVDKDQDLIQ
ncbi:MAG: glucose-1-phosphate adenylyltransferase [Paraglaciecola sp.]|jgi:glucose-1-phosphate adenylyltransferase